MLGRIVRVSVRNLVRRPLRTLLIVQGVLWGTALGISLPAVLRGSRAVAEQDAVRYGTDRILVTQEPVPDDRQFRWSQVAKLRDALRDEVTAVTAYQVRMPRVQYDGRSERVPLRLVDEQFFAARRLELVRGRLLEPEDFQLGRAVVVVSTQTPLPPAQLRPGTQLELTTGETVTIVGIVRSQPVEVDEFGYARSHFLRELAEQMEETLGALPAPGLELILSPKAMYAPHTLSPRANPKWIEIRCPPERVQSVKRKVFLWFSELGQQPIVYANVLATVLYSEAMARIVELNRVVFALAVVVGAVVVSSLMLLNVWERRREIAIRRVEGARSWHIAVQFMVETATTCLLGALAGIPAGLGLAALRCYLSPAAGVSWAVPYVEIAVTLVVVVVTGLAAGLIPAMQAVRVDPVEVLRFE